MAAQIAPLSETRRTSKSYHIEGSTGENQEATDGEIRVELIELHCELSTCCSLISGLHD